MNTKQIHTTALVESKNIGHTTEICAFAHILPRARIGSNCKISDRVYIDNNVVIGDNVKIGVGAYLTGNLEIDSDVYIGPNVGFHKKFDSIETEDEQSSRFTRVLSGAYIGANVTIPYGVSIGINSVIVDGTVIDASVPPNAIVSGNPARIVGYKKAGSQENKVTEIELGKSPLLGMQKIGVGDVMLHRLPEIKDLRGSLTFSEYKHYMPFVIKRYFIIYDVLSDKIRGEHAHKELHEFLVCVKGECSIVVDDGINMKEVTLESPTTGLHIPPGVWVILYKFTKDAVLVVFASDEYDEKDYIRNYDEFLTTVK